ncbi:MAG: T9SS type A sorting domain-containing protein [Crocinitomicaceae bacterium]|nr:T9SS type A sorting domain-containing protein [Crocinitomicaceae bacterium]
MAVLEKNYFGLVEMLTFKKGNNCTNPISRVKKMLVICLTFVSLTTPAQPVFDADGNSYDTVVIGTQTWLKQSLQTTHFANGDLIPTTVPLNLVITSETNPIYQWSYNGIESLAPIYGRLYTGWVATDSRNVCPVNYHVPAISEFNILINYLGGSSIAGSKLKETGSAHWNAPNSDATNESGFTSVGNGNRNLIGTFNDMNLVSDMWSTTQGTNGAWDCDIHAGNSSTTSNDDPKAFGFAIRCVKNDPLAIHEKDYKNEPAIILYQNPDDNFISVNSPYPNDLAYFLFSMQGELVGQGFLISGINQINLDELVEGVYIFRCIEAQGATSLKFIKAF